jgi:hypothetical protein
MLSFFRQRKRAPVDDEKQSHLHISRLIPRSALYSDLYSYGSDHATDPRSRTSSANNTFIVTSTPTSPSSSGTSRPRSSTRANAGTRGSSSRTKDESGSPPHVWPHPSPFSKNGSQTAGEIQNLTGQVAIATSRPVFEGTYSSVYRGTYRDHKV